MADNSNPGHLYEALRQHSPTDPVFLLSEVKARSPRDGDLLGNRNPAQLAQDMVTAGANAISVVTEPQHFGGNLELLETVAATVEVPVLAKDFFETTAEIDRAADHGADAVLLISSELPTDQLEALYRHCLDVGITPLLETHTPTEIETANDLAAPLVGINNRDIGQLELDDGGVEQTATLASLVHDDAFVVSESSLSSAGEVKRAVDAGADAVLVGTAILKADSARAKIHQLTSL